VCVYIYIYIYIYIYNVDGNTCFTAKVTPLGYPEVA